MIEISVHEVSFRFGQREVLTNFSATFAPGRVTALIGPSGSGKSTLLGCIGGYVRPATGHVSLRSVAGTPRVGANLALPALVPGEELASRPEYVGWVPQGANALGARTVLDNVMIGVLSAGGSLEAAREAALSALDQVGMADRAHSFAREVSGGELQRIAFARALASGRPVILADEPTSSLDEANTRNLIDLLHTMRSAATVVVATHDPAVIDAVQDHVRLRAS